MGTLTNVGAQVHLLLLTASIFQENSYLSPFQYFTPHIRKTAASYYRFFMDYRFLIPTTIYMYNYIVI